MLNSKKTNCKSIVAFLLTPMLVMLFSVGSFAQMPQQATPELREDFTNKELKSFVNANEKVVSIQTESQKKMVKTIEDEGLTVDRFNQIIASQQDPKKENNASADEMKSFNSAAQEIMTAKQETQAEVMQTIKSEGIDINTYQEIMYAYQQSPKVKKKVDSIIEN